MGEAMTAADVRACLAARWADSKYLHIYEAPLDVGRQGTKIDVLVVALWQSLKLELDAVEVKVSYSDWRNEVERIDWVVVGEEGRERRHSTRQFAEQWAGWYGGTVERRVVATTAKSQQWRHHAHRFWVAAPADLAARIRPELPEGWGLIACQDGATHALVKATRHEPAPLSWPQTVGLLRATADCGANALMRAEQRGFDRARAFRQMGATA